MIFSIVFILCCRDNIARNKHFLAPEWGNNQSEATNATNEATLQTAIDIYAFGMCALETAALELLPASGSTNGNGASVAQTNGSSATNGQNGATTNGNNPDNEGKEISKAL